MTRARPIVAVSRHAMPGDPAGRILRLADVLEWPSTTHPTKSELIALTTGASVLLCVNGDVINEDLFASCPSLRLIAVASTGYESVDVAAAVSRGIAVTNSRGTIFETTADLTFGLIIAARRRMFEAQRFISALSWVQDELDLMLGLDVHGSTIGILGYGEIGQAVARRAAGFGMTILHHCRSQGNSSLSQWVKLDDLLRKSDILSIHIPLTPQTRNIIGERELKMMKSDATLVNVARGAVIDEAALVRALRENWIGSAGLDVQSVEPNSDPNNLLLGLKNCILLPHIGSATRAARVAMIDMATENILAYLEGRPLLTPVDKFAH